jgi:hypothetical protein
VLRLQGSGLCDLKLDRGVASDQINSYLEPDERSGITSPSFGIRGGPLFKGVGMMRTSSTITRW